MSSQPVALDERLRTVASLVRRGMVVADIGTDHAYLPVYLVQKGICPAGIAADLRSGPLAAARAHVAEVGLTDRIALRLGDGLNGRRINLNLEALAGAAGLEKALEISPDLILLDVMLPGINGFDICKKIRETKNTPVIFVTAKREEIDKISGLGFGADDYIVKPFSPAELVARIKAHINRYKTLTCQNEQEKDVLVRDNIKLFKNTGEAFVGDKEITLTKKEFEVLYILASHPNTIYSKAELFESVWGYDSLGDTSTLTVHINRLRDKIKEADENTDCIKTIWGRGYKFK